MNCNFKKKKGKMWTFVDPKGNTYQKDYILVNRKWRNSVTNAEAYSSFASVGSDHRPVSASIRLSLRSSKATSAKVKYDWRALRIDHDLQERYTVEVRNRYASLLTENDTQTEKYGKFVTSTQEAAKIHIPVFPKRKKSYISDNKEVIEARTNLEKATKEYEQRRSKTNRLSVKAHKKTLNDIYTDLEEKKIDEIVKEINEAHASQQHAKAWKTINELTGRKASPSGKISASTQEERKQKWYDYFSKLLGEKPTPNDEENDIAIEIVLENLGIDDGPFVMEEYRKAKQSLKEGKAAPDDGIVPEILKRCDLDDIMLDFCNKLHIDGEKPDQWGINNIIPTPKKGDLSLVKNYRGIALSTMISKLCNKMILNRIRPKIDEHLRANQNGFRPGRSTIGQILALRRLIEGIRSKNLTAVFTFIDFSKAFDSINREKMFKILKAYGVPPNLLKTIIAMYTNTTAKVISPDGETDLFEINMGVLQGDTLAPFLFVIVLDYAMRKAIQGKEENYGFTIEPRKSRRIPAKTITDLDFADDIALISDLISEAQDLLLAVEKECNAVGLHINAPKTKFMSFNIPEEFELKLGDGTVIGRALTEKKEQDFKYLGSWMDTSSKDLKIRKALTWVALNKMDKIWSSSLKRETKINLFRATGQYVLLYGSETWTINKKLNHSLDGCYTRMLRKVQNVSWKQHLTNKTLYNGLPSISNVIRKRRLKFAGHSYRQHGDPVSELVLWQPKHGKRSKGAPAKTFIDILKEDTGLKNEQELAACMEDREVWRKIVSRLPDKEIDR